MRPRVLITRPRSDAGSLADLLQTRGFDVVALPTLSIQPIEDRSALQSALRQLDSYEWLLFTSRNAVEIVLDEMRALGVSLPASLAIGAVGPRTADAVITRGLEVRCVPEEASGAALGRALVDAGVRGARVLLPSGSRARADLADALRDGGATVDAVTVYRTDIAPEVPGEPMEMLRMGEIGVVALASPSALEGLLSLLGDEAPSLSRVRLVCIGPTTAAAARAAGFEPAAVAEPHTVEGLADAIAKLGMTEENDD